MVQFRVLFCEDEGENSGALKADGFLTGCTSKEPFEAETLNKLNVDFPCPVLAL
jgi:hypothetical protein